MIELRALAALLSYPTAEMRAALPEIADAIRRSPLIASRERAGLDALVAELAAGDLMEAQERYVDLFDRSRATSLNLFEHLYGESRDRGEAMIDLKRVYARAGFELTTFALIVTVVGGLGSVAGAFLAGVLLGVVQSLSAHYIGQYITTIILLGVAALTILVRPRGLLGR